MLELLNFEILTNASWKLLYITGTTWQNIHGM